MFCPKCGNEITGGTKFCPKCGNELVNNQVNTKPKRRMSTQTIGLIVGSLLILFGLLWGAAYGFEGIFLIIIGAIVMFYTKGK